MWKPFVIFVIVTTNLSTLLESYKILNDKSSKTIEAYDQQDSLNLQEEYVEENYSNEDSYKQSSGRVVIGKWRNNGEALEPKWRDGDSVPLAPFSTISFKSGWRKEPDSREQDYQIEPEIFNENRKTNLYSSSRHENHESSAEPEGNHAKNKNANTNNREGKQRSGYKNGYENSSERIKAAASRVFGTFREQLREDNINENIQGAGRYRETLQNYPNDYELFEDENDDPRPRKRRPPEHYEFPGSWSGDNNRREEPDADYEQGPIAQSQSANVANDFRPYLMNNRDPTTESTNQTKPQDNVELKKFLKMQGNNLSLSEILQQKNLTLADLLKGKPNVINILKSNDKKVVSVDEEETSEKMPTLTKSPERNLRFSTTEIPRWSTRRRIDIMRQSDDKNSTFDNQNDSTVLNFAQISQNFETTTSSIMNTTPTEIADNISSFETTKIINDNETVSSGESEENNSSPYDKKHESDSREFLRPLENRESLHIEATTAVEDNTEYLLNDRRTASMSNDGSVPENNNDEDEIMEFSDYPAAKMPKFVPAPILYDTSGLNARRKNNPSSAIRTTNPVEDPDLKLSIERILSSEKKISSHNNEPNDANEDSRKIVSEIGVKNVSIIKQNENSELIKNETQHLKLPEKIDGNSLNKNENEKKNIKSNDFIRNIKDSMKSVDAINIRSNGHEKVSQDQRDLTPNHKLHEVLIPKVDPQSRAEILELFSSGSSAERLERLLASRNMTIEELIALRQRGSSQVHFAEVFKSREQSSTSLPQTSKTNFSYTENSKENRKNKINVTTEKIYMVNKNDNSSTNEDNARSLSDKNSTGNTKKEASKTETEYLVTDVLKRLSENKYLRKNISTLNKTNQDSNNPLINSNLKSRTGIDLKEVLRNSDLMTMLEEFPAGNNIHRDSEGSSYYTSIEAVKLPVQDEDAKKIPDIFTEAKSGDIKSASSVEIGRVKEILNDDLKSLTNLYGPNDYEFSEKKTMSKVKPSIIASGGILGVTIVVFLSIFIACRIQQKKKFAYKNSLTKAVFHNPVMTARKLSNTSSVNTIMVDVVATSTTKRPRKNDAYESDDSEQKSDIDNDSLDANDSWETIPDFMK